MTIQLPENVERSIVAAVQSGRFSSVDQAVSAAWLAFDGDAKPVTDRSAMTTEEFHRQLLAAGLISQLPDAAQDIDDDDEPVIIEGEPLSETMIRERR